MELLIIWLLFAIGAAAVASNRGANGALWFILGFFLGPLGFALAFTTGVRCTRCGSKASEKAVVCPHCHAFLKPVYPQPVVQPAERKCPSCAEMVKAEAIKCRYCGDPLIPVDAAPIATAPADPDPRERKPWEKLV